MSGSRTTVKELGSRWIFWTPLWLLMFQEPSVVRNPVLEILTDISHILGARKSWLDQGAFGLEWLCSLIASTSQESKWRHKRTPEVMVQNSCPITLLVSAPKQVTQRWLNVGILGMWKCAIPLREDLQSYNINGLNSRKGVIWTMLCLFSKELRKPALIYFFFTMICHSTHHKWSEGLGICVCMCPYANDSDFLWLLLYAVLSSHLHCQPILG